MATEGTARLGLADVAAIRMSIHMSIHILCICIYTNVYMHVYAHIPLEVRYQCIGANTDWILCCDDSGLKPGLVTCGYRGL